MKKVLWKIYENTIRSKTFWGVAFMAASPLTGPLAPGVLKAGEILLLVGLGDKAMKKKEAIAGWASVLIGLVVKKKGDKNGK